ncbi:Glutamate-cysteine ligase [Candidatus Cyrtobacter comes]|uniref:Glutamate-cysteine ligase n=1 Tax=Candidatus Cyrtobacter comes TaxID=675776 RepID=A0ABU5L8A9_9RICK|nr:glutamate--cysteine ligase [Candidatus Cyrtobacter comes]MDZ5762361.1 Glutamate-cysteine ligase [Candidatus Cyrtobacter comes]
MFKSLRDLIQNKRNQMEDWIENFRNGRGWPIFMSLDIRISEFKIAHVDSNLFPAGFNNLSINGREMAIKLTKSFLEKYNFSKILLIAERNTKNKLYAHNIVTLKDIIKSASGADVRISVLNGEGLEFAWEVAGTISKVDKNITIVEQGWTPDAIIMNNDLTSGMPDSLIDINQNIFPSPYLGWFSRKKSTHFEIYNRIVKEFSNHFGFDDFLISLRSEQVQNVDFRNKTGLESIFLKGKAMFYDIDNDYKNHKIDEKPYIFLKPNNGTFGMGVLEIRDLEHLSHINKKNRHSIDKIKDGQKTSCVILQEGVQTSFSFLNYPAEKIIYSANGEIVDIMVRYNQHSNNHGNLGKSGALIEALDTPIEFDIEWLINKLANLAAIEELAYVKQ